MNVEFCLSQQLIIQAHMEVLRHLHGQLQRSGPGTGFDLPVMGIAESRSRRRHTSQSG